MEYDIVFFKPKKFDECKKYIEYIKNEKIVHINLNAVEEAQRKRILDFLYGATYIKEGKIETVGENIVCAIPKKVEYLVEIEDKEKTNNEEEEIIPNYDLSF